MDGQNIIAETDASNNIIAEYIRGINLIAVEKNNKKIFYLFNGHGDVVQLTDEQGSVIKNYKYDAFGNELNIDSNDTNPFRYGGEYFDSETGLYYLRARYYDPKIGRFTTEDSYWGKDSDALSLNLYVYCTNNPIRYVDPSGHNNYDATKATQVGGPVGGAPSPGVPVVPTRGIGRCLKGLWNGAKGILEDIGGAFKGVFAAKKVLDYAEKGSDSNKKSKNGTIEDSKQKEVTEAGAPNSKQWKEAKKKIKDGRGKGVNVKVRNEAEAEQLINDARPNLEKRPTYEENGPKSGYEIHPIDNDYNMPHIKWKDWSNGKSNGADGHIFWEH